MNISKTFATALLGTAAALYGAEKKDAVVASKNLRSWALSVMERHIDDDDLRGDTLDERYAEAKERALIDLTKLVRGEDNQDMPEIATEFKTIVADCFAQLKADKAADQFYGTQAKLLCRCLENNVFAGPAQQP